VGLDNHVVRAGAPPVDGHPPGAARLRAVQLLHHHPAGKKNEHDRLACSRGKRPTIKYLLSSRVQVSVPSCGGDLQLTTVAVQCGNCAGVLSVALPLQTMPRVVELPLQVRETTVPSYS
jgi:hypothetical protein